MDRKILVQKFNWQSDGSQFSLIPVEEIRLFYPNETVRLLCELPEIPLAKHAEGTVVRVLCNEKGEFTAAEVRFYKDSGALNVNVPSNGIESVISRSLQERTAVFWGLQKPPQLAVEAAMHFMLDHGFLMREGLNATELIYDRPERWWKWGEQFTDPTGARVVSSAASCDGCIVAFAGRERFHLEFRLHGSGEPTLLLHERDEVYGEQTRRTAPAMSLTGILMNLREAAGAQYCAFPVATPWLMDEDWRSLRREPYYPDFFLLPQAELPGKFPESFRTVKLTEGHAMLTSLPVKSAPHDPVIERSERELKIDGLRRCQALGEKYYDQMYETRFGATGLYSGAKDAFDDAIALANELELKEEAAALSQRLDHIKAVFRRQFS